MTATTRELLEQLSKAIFDAEIADHIPHALLVSVTEHLEPCSPGCPGWAHFNIGMDREGIERCDDCARFADDRAAANAHRDHCSCGMEPGDAAVQCSSCSHDLDDLRGCVENAERRIVCQQCAAEATLDAGATRCRIGADWGVQTWAVAGDLYICDTEGGEGTYELIWRRLDAKSEEYSYELVLESKDIEALLTAAKRKPCRDCCPAAYTTPTHTCTQCCSHWGQRCAL